MKHADTAIAIKYVIASIYTNYTTSVVELGSMDLAEGYTAGPKGNKVVLKYQHV